MKGDPTIGDGGENSPLFLFVLHSVLPQPQGNPAVTEQQ